MPQNISFIYLLSITPLCAVPVRAVGGKCAAVCHAKHATLKAQLVFIQVGWELLYFNIGGQICWLYVLIVTSSLVLATRAGRCGRSLPWRPSLFILSRVSGWMFCPEKEQLSRRTAAAHSVSRWTNQSEFRLSPSISENNLRDIIKVPFCHSRGQRSLLFLTPLCLCCNSHHGTLEATQTLSSWHRLEMFLVFIPVLRHDFCFFTPIQSDSVTHSRGLPNPPLSLFPR